IVNGLIVTGQIAPVLSIRTLEAADRAHPKSIKVTPPLGRISLEIPVQRPITLCGNKLVRGKCEVVHPDIPVTGFREFARRQAEYPEFFQPLRKMTGKAPLLLFEPWNMSVAEQSDSVGPHLDHFIHCGDKALHCLVWKPKDQVDVDAVKAQAPAAV